MNELKLEVNTGMVAMVTQLVEMKKDLEGVFIKHAQKILESSPFYQKGMVIYSDPSNAANIGILNASIVPAKVSKPNPALVDKFFKYLQKHPCKFWYKDSVYNQFTLFTEHIKMGALEENKPLIDKQLRKMCSTRQKMLHGVLRQYKTWNIVIANAPNQTIRRNLMEHYIINKTAGKLIIQ